MYAWKQRTGTQLPNIIREQFYNVPYFFVPDIILQYTLVFTYCLYDVCLDLQFLYYRREGFSSNS